MAAPEHVVIIGGGLAGAKTAQALREQGFEGRVTIIAEERHLPYERPPLCKGYLAGETTFDDSVVHPADWYRDNDIDLRLGTCATGIDPAAHEVEVDQGDPVGYDKLVLATGAVPRTLSLPGAEAEGVLYLRTREDSDRIRANFGPGRRLVIIGAGWIGLEVAAAARGADTAVTVIEAAELPLLRVLGPEMAEVFAGLHREHDVDLRLGASLTAITTVDGRATGVELASGETIPADAIVVGVGVTPNISLADAAGLATDNGVLVDAGLRTSDPDIYAIGDIANHDHPVLGRRVRVEHWANALNQPAAAVASLLGGDTHYTELPYFYTDQYDLGMEYIGYASQDSYAQVVTRGDVAGREFVAFWLDGEHHIQAAMPVNTWDIIDEIKPLIADRQVVDPMKLADPDVPWSAL